MLKSLICTAALAASLMVIAQPAFADPLRNAMYHQRIGNYDFQVATEPSKLIAGQTAKIVMRISGVNGDDVVDVPLKLRLVRDGAEIASPQPVIIQYGHYAYDHTFESPGKYVLYADIMDNAYSGQTLTFTFILNVAGQNDYYLYTVMPGVGAAGAAAAGAIVVMRKRKARI